MHQDKTPDRPVQLDLLKKLNQRNQDALVGNKHAEDQSGEKSICSTKLPLRKDVTVSRPEDRRNNRCWDR